MWARFSVPFVSMFYSTGDLQELSKHLLLQKDSAITTKVKVQLAWHPHAFKLQKARFDQSSRGVVEISLVVNDLFLLGPKAVCVGTWSWKIEKLAVLVLCNGKTMEKTVRRMKRRRMIVMVTDIPIVLVMLVIDDAQDDLMILILISW